MTLVYVSALKVVIRPQYVDSGGLVIIAYATADQYNHEFHIEHKLKMCVCKIITKYISFTLVIILRGSYVKKLVLELPFFS
jgi:hypothetical protein